MTQPPSLPPLNYATPQSGTDLRKVAKDQRALMCCILAYFIAFILQFALPPGLRWVLGLVALAVSITGMVFVFKLAIELYSTGAGVVLGILTLIPLIGLIILLVVNSKATNLLKAHGIKVGLMGADVSQIPAPGQIRV